MNVLRRQKYSGDLEDFDDEYMYIFAGEKTSLFTILLLSLHCYANTIAHVTPTRTFKVLFRVEKRAFMKKHLELST